MTEPTPHVVYNWVQGVRVTAPCDCAVGETHLPWVLPGEPVMTIWTSLGWACPTCGLLLAHSKDHGPVPCAKGCRTTDASRPTCDNCGHRPGLSVPPAKTPDIEGDFGGARDV